MRPFSKFLLAVSAVSCLFSAQALSQPGDVPMTSIPESSLWGYTLDFNGALSQYARATGPVTSQTDNITLEAWVRWDGTTTASPQVIVSNGYSNSDGYGLYLNPTNNYLAILVSTITWYEPAVTLTPNVWTHVALVRNSGTWALYKNGQSIPIGAPTANPLTPSTNVFVGGDSVSNYFRGDIDEVRISTVARYTSNFSVSLIPFISDGSTAALYHFDEGSGSTSADASGNGNDLTLINGPVWDGRAEPIPDLVATTEASTGIDTSSATLNGSVNPYGQSTTVRFLYGATSGVYTDSLDAVPSTVSGNSATAVSASLDGLNSGTTYYYVVAATNSYGYLRGNEKSVTTESPLWGHTLDFGVASAQYAKAGGPATTQTDNITLEGWVRWDGTATASAQMIVSNGYSGTDGYGLYLNPTNNYLAILVSAVAWYEPSVTLTPDVWTHVALVRSSGTWALYKNGQSIPIGAPTSNPITPGSNTFVGGDSVSNYFHGDIDEVRVSTVARYTSDFITPREPFSTDGNTATLYHFDEGTGSTSADSSGNGNDLTLLNSPIWNGSDNPAMLMVLTTETATNIDTSTVTLHGTVYPYGDTATVRFLYGTASGVYTDSADAVPSTVSGDSVTNVSAVLTDLNPGTVYYYVLEAVSNPASARGTEGTFATKSESWGYALDFNGASSEYAKAGGVVTVQTDNVTMEAWVKWDGTATAGAQMIVSNGYSASDGYGLYLNPTNNYLAILVSAVTWYEPSVTLTPDVWTHVALVRSSGTWALYKNGQSIPIGTPTANPITPSTNTFVGGDSVGNNFYGDIDEVRISTVARYTSNFTVSLTPFASDGNTTALYHFDEGSGSISADASGNGNVLTLINSPDWDGRAEPLPGLTVVTVAATDVETSSVTLHGTVNPFGFNTTVRFLYGTATGVYTDSIDAVPSTVSGDSATSVSASLTGLSGGTTYYYVVAATNGYEYNRGGEATILTGPIDWRKAVRFDIGNVKHAKAGGVVTTVTDNFTIEAWVKWDGTNTSFTQLIASNGYSGSDGYGLYLYSDTKLAILISAKGWLQSDSTLTPGEWTHVAMVRNSGTWALYKNGISLSLGGDAPTDPNAPSTNFFVGGDSVSNYFNGDIDEVRVSTTARYTSTFVVNRWPFTSDAHAAALYHFDEGSGLASADSSGNSNDLTLTGTPNNPTWVDSDNPFVPLTLTTSAASGIGIAKATLNGTVDPNGYPTTVRFLYGTTSGVYTDSVEAVPGSVSSPTAVSALPTNLVGSTSYYYVIAASSLLFYARGSEQNFSTSSAVWGNGVKFNSSNNSYAKAGSVATTQTDDITLEAWVKWDGTSNGSYQGIISNGDPLQGGYGLYLYTNNHAAILIPGIAWAVSSNPLPSELWVHLVAQRKNGTWTLYQSGQIQNIGSPTANPIVPTNGTIIGGDSVGHSFNGEIDEVRISTIARYSSNFVSNFGPFTPDAHTAALYHFTEGSGSTTGDSSGHDINLTLFNAAAWIGSDNPHTPVRIAVTDVATNVGSWTATLHGRVNPNGDASVARFLYGTTSGVYTDSVTAVPDSVVGSYTTPITAAVSGLTNGAVYYYVIAAGNNSWYERGAEQSFRTFSPVWGSALSFTAGASQYGKAGGVVTTATDDFTIEAWVKWDGINSAAAQLIASNGYSGSDGYGLYLFSDTKLAILISAKAWLRSDSTLTPGEWTHVAMARNGGTWSLYRNGTSLTLGGDSPTDPNTPVTNFFVGGDSTGSYFYGDIDEVRVSPIVRYSSNFSVSNDPFGSDASTATLYHFNEGSGSTASDFSGNGNVLTLLNGPAWVINDNSNATQISPFPGTALSFPGSGSNYVEVPHSPLLNPSDNFTVELWVRPEGGEGTYRCPLGSEESSPSAQGYYFYAADDNTWQVWIGNGSWNVIASSVPVSLNTWTHLALTFSSDTARFYVNGTLTNTEVDNSFQANTVAPFRIGDIGETPGVVPWNGRVDEVRVWSVARSAQQIRELMHRILPESSAGLVAYFQLNEGSGSSTKDLHGGFTGSITGSPTWVSSSAPVGIGSSTSAMSFTSGTANLGTLSLVTTDSFDNMVDLVSTAIDVGPNATAGIGGTVLDDRYWIINAFGTPGTFVANLTFTVPSSFTYSGGASAPLYTLYHRSGAADTTWDVLVSGASSLTGTTITFEGITTFSQFAIGTVDPLPIEMLTFTATVGANGVTLHWQTGTEVDNAGWEVERRQIAGVGSSISTWEQIGFVEGSGTSTSTREYSYIDNPPFSRTAYRLKQLDRSGGFSYSLAVEVVFVPVEYELYQNYPNPFNPATTVRFDLKQPSTVTLEIYDLLGRRVFSDAKGLMQAGRYNEVLDLGKLSTGVYAYRILADGVDGERFSAVRKMLLVK